MSMNPPVNPNWMEPPPPRQGMSGAAKVLVGLGIGCGVMMVLCCGGFIALSVYFKQWLDQSIASDPAAVRQIGSEIARIEIPDDLQPAFAMDIKVPFTGQPIVKSASYADKASQSVLTLMAFSEMAGAPDQGQVQAQIQQELRNRGLRKDQPLSDRQSRERKIKVRGEEAVFTVAAGKDAGSGKSRLEVTGSFSGENGRVLLMIDADAEKYPEDRIVKMLESIK